MSERFTDILARGDARIVEGPVVKSAPRHQVEVDRQFELPKALYAATVGLYLTFCAVMWMGFSSPGLALPMVIFGVFIAAGFGVPAIWTKLKDNSSEPRTMGEFAEKGIMTHTGRLTARDASVQMLILPSLIVMWGLSVLVIAAFVA
ncbi:hypothetical protein [Erythrobacter sp. YT30]|uniref:hypothetical protein n=1 Tax=Erythrobacter sp. YT30 TaxID=1735012 RepID=UPI00076C44E7|nr:hypothetical protein [Erythrobacter sp. YT30]KWV90577.1 hypothetical protein AUC45_15235 [Erythrobacter sp. YT30]